MKIQNLPNNSMIYAQNREFKFTYKQKNVIKMLADGKSYREISEALDITRPTIRSHLTAIYNKLGVTNKDDAIKALNSAGGSDMVLSELT